MSESRHGRLTPSSAVAQLLTLDVAGQSLDTLLDGVTGLAQRSLGVPAEVSLTLLSKQGPATIAYAGARSLALDETQYDLGDGPCLQAARTGEPVAVPDTAQHNRWPTFMSRVSGEGIGSTLSLPLLSQQVIGGALNFYAEPKSAFDADTTALAEAFAGYAAVAIANTQLFTASTRLAEQLKEAMASRAVIEQAKGILMAQHKIDADAAFDLLRTGSQRSNIKLREVAGRVVAQATTKV